MDQSPSTERLFRVGRGNWDAFDLSLDVVLKAAEAWANAIDGVKYPWLCWNVDHDWSIVQQRLVTSAGWTPVVGFDPRVGPPPTIPETIVVDFNADFGLPILYPHFVLEFVFAFAERLAFWHSDLLLTEQDMAAFAKTFEALEDGTMAAVTSRSGLRGLFSRNARRYWELLGCTTRGASRSQFDQGCGWWMHFDQHPNFKNDDRRQHHWEYGCGIHHWKKVLKGDVLGIKEDRVAYGHFTRIGNNSYRSQEKNNVFRNLGTDLGENYRLKDCTRQLSLCHLLPN